MRKAFKPIRAAMSFLKGRTAKDLSGISPDVKIRGDTLAQ